MISANSLDYCTSPMSDQAIHGHFALQNHLVMISSTQVHYLFVFIICLFSFSHMLLPRILLRASSVHRCKRWNVHCHGRVIWSCHDYFQIQGWVCLKLIHPLHFPINKASSLAIKSPFCC